MVIVFLHADVHLIRSRLVMINKSEIRVRSVSLPVKVTLSVPRLGYHCNVAECDFD